MSRVPEGPAPSALAGRRRGWACRFAQEDEKTSSNGGCGDAVASMAPVSSIHRRWEGHTFSIFEESTEI